jgi:CelD/BcsL family acetyltransferase involved in cellulose biosynthesis
VARVIVGLARQGVLRVAVGPARRQMESQAAGLAVLRDAGLPAANADRVAWLLASGREGLADWTLERRLPGRPAPFPLPERTRRESLDFLVDLFGAAAGSEPRTSTAADAALVARFCGPAEGAALRRLGERAEQALADVTRGYAHGDFWAGNLLTEGERLTGVADWDAAGAGRLPVLDLMHLAITAERPLPPDGWGQAIVDRLLPWAREGADPQLREYLAAIGLEAGPERLEDLVVAYWLDRLAYQLGIYAELTRNERFVRRNVGPVLAALRERRRPRPAGPQLALELVKSLDELRPEWDDLAERSRNLFSTWEWNALWWEHFGRGRELATAACRDGDGRLVAVLPLYVWRSVPLRTLRFVGHGPSDALGPICAPADVPAAAAALHRLLGTARWDAFVAEQLPGDQDWGALVGGRLLAQEGNPVLRFDGRTWEELLASRSRNFREQVGRRERKLFREHDAAFRLAAPAALDADLDVLFSLHRALRQGRSTAFLGDAEPFHRAFAHAAQERGWLRLWFLEIDGRAVAAWYGFRYGGAELYYQAGRDPEWDRAAVGFVLLVHTIRSALEDGVREYRFLRGDEPYKYRFATEDQGLETRGLTRGPAGRAALAVAAGLHAARLRLR